MNFYQDRIYYIYSLRYAVFLKASTLKDLIQTQISNLVWKMKCDFY